MYEWKLYKDLGNPTLWTKENNDEISNDELKERKVLKGNVPVGQLHVKGSLH